MDKIRKMREKQKKKKIVSYISNKIMDLAKNLENNARKEISGNTW